MTTAAREVVVAQKRADLPYSPLVAYGELLFVSGKIGRDPHTGEIARGDAYKQTWQTMENIRADLEQAGSGFDKVLKTTIFVTEVRWFARVNEAYGSFFESDPPARSTVGVAALPDPDAVVEIEMVAHR